ncbi:MAG: hypothetical protein A3E79_13845 [Burkholderiales bacterium RIFCSPHIGHO2_12_FULL_61_11]|nr:MAG: hypothetical protein A3E79_13845 [Burkholderiales bacterium RIFCSPHIGHO2_12_FULL_61_11]
MSHRKVIKTADAVGFVANCYDCYRRFFKLYSTECGPCIINGRVSKTKPENHALGVPPPAYKFQAFPAFDLKST